MALYIGDELIAGDVEGQKINNPFSLLDYKYSEYEISNASWLLSNGQWNSGAVYQSVYNLLLQIYNGTTTKAGVSVKLSTDTYADTDFVLNTTDTTFRLPLYNQRVLVKKYVNGTEWYNLYSDGWCEQGFCYSPSSSSAQTINLLKEYKDTNYTVQTTYNTGSDWGNPLSVYNKTVNNFTLTTKSTWSTSSVIAISVCGYANIPTSSDFTEIDGLYFYVGETVQDANIIAAGQALTDIADLKNASNFSQTGLSTLSGLGMPSNRYIDLTLGASGTQYTAPANGYFILMYNTTSADSWALMQNESCYNIGIYQLSVNFVAEGSRVWCSAKKGDICTSYYQNITPTRFIFIYAEGESNV